MKTTAVHIFEEVSEIVERYFYDSNMIDTVWKRIKNKYYQEILRSNSIDNSLNVINRMLFQLKTSHTYLYTYRDSEYYQLLDIFDIPNPTKEKLEYPETGIMTKELISGIYIKAVLDGSPADKAGLLVGDRIISVDGEKYRSFYTFLRKYDQSIVLMIQRNSDAETSEIKLIPEKIAPRKSYLKAIKSSTSVIDYDTARIGYIHIWSYAGEENHQLLKNTIESGSLKDVDGLILDLRYGWGGANLDYLNIFTNKSITLTQKFRSETLNYNSGQITSTTKWTKPVVMIINEDTRSGKEILAFGFKNHNIGKVIGTTTAGAVVCGRPFILQDGSLLYMAVADVYVNNERLEGKGVKPDIYIPCQLEYAQGKDSQKNMAMKILYEEIQKNMDTKICQ